MPAKLPASLDTAAKQHFGEYVLSALTPLLPAASDAFDQGTMVIVPFNPARATKFAHTLRAFSTAVNNDARCKVFVAFGTIVGAATYGVVLLPKRGITPPTGDSPPTGHHASGVGDSKRKGAFTMAQLAQIIPKVDAWLATTEGQQQLRHDDEQAFNYELVTVDPEHPELRVETRAQAHDFETAYLVELDDQLNVVGITESPERECPECSAAFKDAMTEPWNLWGGR